MTKTVEPRVVESTRKYAYIDGLRGIAILMVVLFHQTPSVVWKSSATRFDILIQSATSLGQMGVQLFFVASALTLCLSL